jgi:hypothetical protein
MKRMKTLAILAFALTAGVSSLNAGAENIDPANYGVAAQASRAARVVDITPGTRHVNVIDGETVTFNLDGQQFTWTFHVNHGEGVVALAAIVPKALDAHGVMVYVGPDLSYR